MMSKKTDKIFFIPNPDAVEIQYVDELPSNSHKVIKLFVELTKSTCPHPNEDLIYGDLMKEIGATKDPYGNYFKWVKDPKSKKDPITMFTSHLDTADLAIKTVNHVFYETKDKDVVEFWAKTDQTSILGADCKAGTALQLWMIQNNVPGLYYFFKGEECGLIGCRELASAWKDHPEYHQIKHCISFDRKDIVSVITKQAGNVCCSKEFCEALIEEIKGVDPTIQWKDDPTGTCTDSLAFIGLIPECTNLSVGYWSQHSHNEKQNLTYLAKLAEAFLKIKWEELPIVRKPEKISLGKYAPKPETYYNSSYKYPQGTTNTSKEKIISEEETKILEDQLLASLIYCENLRELASTMKQNQEIFLQVLLETVGLNSEELIRDMIINMTDKLYTNS